MTISPLKQAILGRCREVLTTRERNQVCPICWLPDEWPPSDVWLALHEMRRDGIIACTRGSSLLEDGFCAERAVMLHVIAQMPKRSGYPGAIRTGLPG